MYIQILHGKYNIDFVDLILFFYVIKYILIEKRQWNSINQEGVNWFSKQNVLLKSELQNKTYFVWIISQNFMNRNQSTLKQEGNDLQSSMIYHTIHACSL